MENSNNYTSEELAKCPYHAQLSQEQNNDDREEANTGDWEDQRDEDGTDPNRYEEEGGNNNSGGAGSSGSAATNS
ncbi:hypothetical protein [Flavobacterium hibisci]|uniref:hypothetical protein n=1 Tax=Flavobacterium hibisci TaxID=1914462 RepID=UPI001CBB2CEE|nr:hypothetical protein [Flavobacterium hibisci]MBZ4041045.1 hypothetical protein [Flavobacterium hibisci]